MAQQNDFNFSTFNNLVSGKPAGLQLFLAIQLMSNALFTLEAYDNPRAPDMRDIMNEAKALRAKMKDDAAARAKKSD